MKIETLSDSGSSANGPEWGSDIVAEMLRRLGMEYVAIMPGASFRGLQDSFVNYGKNEKPGLLLCIHENAAVGIARGYARATKKPMAVILHNVVGLLAGSMGVFDSWIDRSPMLLIGSTGPVDAAKRRPLIDGMHTANVQGNLVRDFTKWDDQPASFAALTEALLRANRICRQEPPGPVYVCVSTDIQEAPVPDGFVLPDVTRYAPASAPAPSADVVETAAQWLMESRFPVAIADRSGRDEKTCKALVDLAELLAMPVIDQGWGWRGFPSPHPLDFTGDEGATIAKADLILALDCTDLAGEITNLPAGAKVINISSDELLHRGFTAEYQALPVADLPILASPETTLPLLLEKCAAEFKRTETFGDRIGARRKQIAADQASLSRRNQAFVSERNTAEHLTETALWVELATALADEPYCVTMGNSRRQAPGVMSLGVGLNQDLAGEAGGAVGMMVPVALGSAMAVSKEGRLPVAVIGDGEFLAGASAIWTAAKYAIPSLIVVNNNRSFLSDEHHQVRIAQLRQRPVANAGVAMTLVDPACDVVSVVRGFGGVGLGPVSKRADYAAALREAIPMVKAGKCVVIDCLTEYRELKVFKERAGESDTRP